MDFEKGWPAMMVTFISQCEKKALKKTRRVLDAFADRIGDNAWQTASKTGWQLKCVGDQVNA